MLVLRISRQTSNPSIFGNIKSKSTKSGFSAAKTANPSSPSNAVTTSKPSFDKLNLTISEIGFSSSTTKIFFITSSSLTIERLGNLIYYPKHLLKCWFGFYQDLLRMLKFLLPLILKFYEHNFVLQLVILLMYGIL